MEVDRCTVRSGAPAVPDDELELFVSGAIRFELDEFLVDLQSPESTRFGKVSLELWRAVASDLPAILIRRN
jgi:hypothetical protein